MICHGKAEVEKKAKKGDSELSKPHRNNGSGKASDEASLDPPPSNQDDTPRKLDPSLMASATRGVPANLAQPPAPASLPEDANSRYAWKRQIVTTTFWIGESSSKNNPVPNEASSWDPKWSKNYGGTDEPDVNRRTSEFTPAKFTPGQNPFYIALPYNDMEHGAHKAEASKIIPWFHQEYQGPTKSVCKDRWIAIRFGNKVCYAQWEDAGPFRTDHAAYVFGEERPKPNLNQGAGLDVAPAVRDYLGMNSTDVSDWKFVDFDEVPPGPWSKFGENNTFVQNARRSLERVAELMPQESKAERPVAIRPL